MTKRRKALPARKPRERSRDDDSLLLRSAESLGRVIGALQRQLDGATKRLLNTDDVIERIGRKVEKPKTKKAKTKRATTKKATTRKMKTPAKTQRARTRAKKR